MSRVIFDTFTIERTLDATPDRVFEALSKPDVKAKWFVGPPGWKPAGERRMDFRVCGREHVAGEHVGGITSVFDAEYLDIVPNERVVYVYEMTVNGAKISTSLATFELVPDGKKTKLVLTEQGAYFGEGHAKPRVDGTQGLMDQLAGLFRA